MGGDQRLAAVDGGLAVGLECVGRIIEAMPEQQPDEAVEDPVQNQLVRRVIDDATTFEKAATEHRVRTLVEKMPIANHVPAIVGFVGHHNYRSISLHRGEAVKDGAADSMPLRILNRVELRDAFFEFGEDLPRAVGTAIINHHDFVRHLIEVQFEVQVFHGTADAALFVPCWNHNTQEFERGVTIGWTFVGGFVRHRFSGGN